MLKRTNSFALLALFRAEPFGLTGTVGFSPNFVCTDPRAPRDAICYFVYEAETSVSVYVKRFGGVVGDISVTYQAQNITAEGYGDFTAVSGSLFWKSGDSSARVIEVPIQRDDAGYPLLEFFRVALFNGDPLVPIVAPSTQYAYVAIIDKDSGGSITIEAVSPLIYESSGEARFVISRNGAGVGLARVTYESIPGTALSDVDFKLNRGELFWADGESGPKQVSVELVRDHAARYGRYFKDLYMHIIQVSDNVFLDPRSNIASTVVADDGAQTGFFLFDNLEFDPLTRRTLGAPAAYSVNERDGVVRMTVARKGGVQGNVTVRFRTEDVSALATRNYHGTGGTLSWEELDATPRNIEVRLIDDTLFTPGAHRSVFRVVLDEITVHDGTLTSSGYHGPESVVAEVEIIEDDGPGVFALTQSMIEVSEGNSDVLVNFTVLRLGGSDRAVSVKYRTVAGSATTPLLNEMSGMDIRPELPVSCEGATMSGIRVVQGAGGVAREIYCAVSDSLGDNSFASGSIFLWDNSARMLWNRTCTSGAAPGGGRDHMLLWRDLRSRVSLNEDDKTTVGDFVEVQAGGRVATVEGTVEVPAGMGQFARPVPFPLHGVVAWFDWENQQVLWSGEHSGIATFESMQIISEDLGLDSPSFYVITDGISSVHVGRTATDSDDEITNSSLVVFNFSAGTALARNLSTPMKLTPEQWCEPEKDAYGHVLWTVNGRVMYRNCSQGTGGERTLALVHGGPIHDPMNVSEQVDFEICPGNFFEECGAWLLDVAARGSGVDLFAQVDEAGYLLFGDAGQDGGLFHCETGTQLGTMRTGIELGHTVANDFESTSGTLTWERDDLEARNFSVRVLVDSVVDSSVEEEFHVELYEADKAGVDSARASAVIRIIDREGAGRVEIVPQQARVGEREFCCRNCGADYLDADRTWCATFDVRRSSSRGDVCVNYTAVGRDSGEQELTAEAGQQFTPKISTICWSHGDASLQEAVIELPFHPSYDRLLSVFNVTLGNTNIRGIGYRGPASSAMLYRDARQEVADEDATAGVATLRSDEGSGQAVLVVQTSQTTALLYADRLGGTDTDLTAHFTTVQLPARTFRELPASITVRDGSRGTNTFCVALSDRVEGSCVDSSSNARCVDGFCTTIYPSLVSSSTEGQHFLRAEGSIYWREGESGLRAIPVRILSTVNGTTNSTVKNSTSVVVAASANESAAYRAFSVQFSNVTSSLQGQLGAPPLLADKNSHGSCSPEACVPTGPTDVISACNLVACRKSATREAFVLTPAGTGSGQLRLVNSTYFVTEGIPENSVFFSVQRVGGSVGSITVKYATFASAVPGLSVAAIDGHDYLDVNGTLEWEDGDAEDKEIFVPIIDDELYTKGRLFKSFYVELFNSSENTKVTGAVSCFAVIVDDDPEPGTIQVLDTRQTFAETAGTATLTLARVGGNDTAVYVRFHTGLGGTWDSVTVQSSSASAHAERFADQSYACQTTLRGKPDASVYVSRESGGGEAGLAFDQDLTTFWDGSIGGLRGAKEWLLYDFDTCQLAGANVTGYSLRTAKAGVRSGCPAAWQFQGSNDGIEWTVLDVQGNRECTPDGRSYDLSVAQGLFRMYRWYFLEDVDGFNGIRIYEAGMEFANFGIEGSELLQAQVCDESATCCVFDDGECYPAGGNDYQSLMDMSYDYTYTRGIVFWAEGDTSLKTINISLLDDCMGCSESTCAEFDQQQDRPYEMFPVHLTVGSDLEIRALPGGDARQYPFRRDAQIDTSHGVATVLVEDDDGPGVIALSTDTCGGKRGGSHVEGFVTQGGFLVEGNDAKCPVLESVGSVDFLVERYGGSRGAVTVAYEVTGLDAESGVHFRPANGTLTWSHGDAGPRFFSVQVFDVPVYQTGKYVKSLVARLKGFEGPDGVSLVEGGAVLKPCTRQVMGVCVEPARAVFEVAILSNDAEPGDIVIDRADLAASIQYSVLQSAGQVKIPVKRVGGSDMPIQVSYTTTAGKSASSARPCVNGTALSECEYHHVTGVLKWEDGDASVKYVEVKFTESLLRSQRETFGVSLSGKMNDTIGEFCGGYSGTTFKDGVRSESALVNLHCSVTFSSAVTVTINSNPAGGTFQIYSHAWPFLVEDASAAVAVFWIERALGSKGIVSVEARSEGDPYYGTAQPGVHFVPLQETYTWYDGDSSPRFVRVEILADTVPDNTLVELRVRLAFNSINSGLNLAKNTARLFIKPVDFVPMFLSTSIKDSTNVLDTENEVFFSFSTNVIAGPGALVTISELLNTGTPSGELEVSGKSASTFGSVGFFDQVAGTLTLEVHDLQSIDPDVEVAISFTVRNGNIVQPPRVPAIELTGEVGCTTPRVGSIDILCPSSFQVPKTSMEGRALGFIILSVVAPYVETRLCTYPICPHASFISAYNNITLSLLMPIEMPPESTLTISGLQSSTSVGVSVPIFVMNMSRTRPTYTDSNRSALCTCSTPACTCESTLDGIVRAADLRLQVQIQCNALGWMDISGERLTLRVGDQTSDQGFVVTNNQGFTDPPRTCEDNCTVYHDLFPTFLDVREQVTPTGQLYVSITTTTKQDYCNLGEYIRARITVHWTSGVLDMVQDSASWDAAAGMLIYTVPQGYKIAPLQPIALYFPLRNPAKAHSGSNLVIEGNTPNDVKVGPTPVEGTVLITQRAAAIEIGKIEESTAVQGSENVLVLRLAFNGFTGGRAEGMWVTVSGLIGTATPDSDELPVELCSLCQISANTYQDLSPLVGNAKGKFSGTALWRQEAGQLIFWLRGPAPTFSISPEGGDLIGMIRLENSRAAGAGGAPVLTIGGETVEGAGALAPFPVKIDRPILTASVSMDVFSGTLFGYASVDGYARPEEISISFTANHALNFGDRIIIKVPGLTTCETFCADGVCEEMGCGGISGFYIDAAQGSNIAGAEHNFFTMSWDEAKREISLATSGGRAVCANNTFAISFKPSSYNCDKFECALKALPDDIAATRGARMISTNALGCATESSYCSPPTSSSFSNIPVEVVPGSYWGQRAHDLSLDGSRTAEGRVWFAAQVHDGALFVLGGLTAAGFAEHSRVSYNGSDWNNTGDASHSFGARSHLAAVSFRGELWVLGGRGPLPGATGNAIVAFNDVWRSRSGVDWTLATSCAAWPARTGHVALAHHGRLYVVAGASAAGGEDVWASEDGVNWDLMTWHAEFGERTGHGVVSHAGYMWLYGGGPSRDQGSNDVWKSADGKQWRLVTNAAPWTARNVWSAVAYDNRLWLIGGYQGAETLRDVWWSVNGSAWEKVVDEAHWGGRFGAVGLHFKNRLWVLGGSIEPCDEVSTTSCQGAAAEAECKGFYRECRGNDVWSDAYASANFVRLEAQISTEVVGADNTVNLCAALDRELVTGSSLRIKGLNHDRPTGSLEVRGRDAYLFDGYAAWNASTGDMTLTLQRTVTAHLEVCVSLTVVNSPPPDTSGGELQAPELVVSATSRSDRFALSRGQTFLRAPGSLGTAAPRGGMHEISTRDTGATEPMVFDGGIMFDVEVLRSAYVTGFTVGLQPQVLGQSLEQELFVYYKEGTHTAAPVNISEWRLLGSIVVPPEEDHNEFSFGVRDLQAFQELEDTNATRTIAARCAAGNHLFGDCDAESCVTRKPRAPLDANFSEDPFPFDYAPERFCVNETYCEYGLDGACVCTAGSPYDCMPGFLKMQGWLGPRPDWAQNTSHFMSSSLVRGVNFSGVLAQAPGAMWISGEGLDPAESEAGCPHLPLCPPSWPYNKNQILALDLGVCHTFSKFRTKYPVFDDAPTIFYQGVERLNMRDEYWQMGHFREFELQHSTNSLEGPWTAVLADEAPMQADGWQEFSFQPATARYWRLVMKSNHGFTYIVVGALEFFGFESIWCHQSRWCHESNLCPTGEPDVMQMLFEPLQTIRPRGFALAAGTHSLYVRSTHGLNVTRSSGRRSDALAADGRLHIKYGTLVQHTAPSFAWESPPHATAFQVVGAQSAAADNLNSHTDGFVLVARFQTQAGSNDGTLLALGGDARGENCEGTLRVRVKNGAVGLEQGCTGVPLLEVGDLEGFALAQETSYCYIAAMRNGTLEQRLERAFPLDVETATSRSVPFNASALPYFDTITVGAALACGNATFPGTVMGAAVYEGQLEGASLSAACRRRCDAVRPDGSCYERANLLHEQALLTAGAADFEFMRLPAPAACYSRFRLQVSSSAAPNWCVQELALFADTAPFWNPYRTLDPARAAASSHAANYPPAAAFDMPPVDVGRSEHSQDNFFCAEGPDGWLEYDLGYEACVEAYGIKSLAVLDGNSVTQGMPSSWTLLGSNDGEQWHTVDERSGVAFGESMWRRFETRVEQREFLFVANFFNTSLENGHNALSRLYRWTGPVSGFAVQQEIATVGARSALHFKQDGAHFLAVAGMLDSSVASAERVADTRTSDSQVGSAIYVWHQRTGLFRLHETLPTNNSAGFHVFRSHNATMLFSADHRSRTTGNGSEAGQSILFRRAGNLAAPRGDCHSCGCGTTLEGASTDSSGQPLLGPLAHVLGPRTGVSTQAVGTQAAFDGDYSTAWEGTMSEADWHANNESIHSANNTYNSIATTDAALALMYNFSTCERGAEVTGYAIVPSASGCPLSWVLEASGDDGSTWRQLHHVPPAAASNASCAAGVPRFYVITTHGKFGAYRLRFGPGLDSRGAVLFTPVAVAEVEFTFANEMNDRRQEMHNNNTHEYEFEPRGPPYRSVYRDEDGGPVVRFRRTEFETEGAYGTMFDLALEDGHAALKQRSECALGDTLVSESFWDDASAPFSACSAEWGLCTDPEVPVCFAAESLTGACAGGDNSGSSCSSDADCDAGVRCVPPELYSWKLSFRRPVRLIAIKMRGCGWCGGKVAVLDGQRNVIMARNHSGGDDCSACNTWTLPVGSDAVGSQFFISDRTFAPFALRSAVSLQWEPIVPRWEEVQLLPSAGASDSASFVAGGAQYLVVAHYRAYDSCYGDVDCEHPPGLDPHDSCYGDIECTNPEGADPLVKDTFMPYNIESRVWRFDEVLGQFVPHQDVATRGALDLEHFVIAGRHFLAVANNFDSARSTARTTSTVFRWEPLPSNATNASSNFTLHEETPCDYGNMSNTTNATNGSSALCAVWGFVAYQELPTHDARQVRHFQKDSRHYLAVAGSPGERIPHSIVIWRWDGVRFVYAGEAATGEAAALEVFEIEDALYLAVAVAQAKRGAFEANSSILRWQEAAQWHGSLLYSDAYSPEAQFVVRNLTQDSTTADGEANLTLTLQPDRTIPAGERITISNLVGSLTLSGQYPLSGSDSDLFGGVWTFSADNGTAEFVASVALPASKNISVTFVLRNGPDLRAPVRAIVSSSGGEVTFLPAACTGLVLGVDTLSPANITHFTVEESSSIRLDVSNRITVELRANRELPKDAVIEVQGLIGTETPDGEILLEAQAVSAATRDEVLGTPDTSATWVQETGTLRLALSAGLAAYEYLAFSVTLANPSEEQDSVRPTLQVLTDASAGAELLFPPVISEKSVLSGAVAPSLTVARLFAQHSVSGAVDRLLVQIQPSVPILAGATFKIAGIVSGEKEGSVLPLIGRQGERFFTEASWSVVTKSQATILQGINFQVGPNCTTECADGKCPPAGDKLGTGGQEHGADCVFPFTFDTKTYSACTKVGSSDGRPWCGTASSVAGIAAAGPSVNWGYCVCHDSIPADEITEFAFDLTVPLEASPGSQPTIQFEGRVQLAAVPLQDAAGNQAVVLASQGGVGALSISGGLPVTAPMPSQGDVSWPLLVEHTIELWIKVSAGTRQRLVSIGDALTVSATGTARQIMVSQVDQTELFTEVVFDDSKWHHLAVTWSNLDGKLALYRDGQLVQAATAVHVGQELDLLDAQLALGGLASSDEVRGEQTLALAEVRLWSVQMDDAEVAALWETFLVGHVAPQALLAHYDFTRSLDMAGEGDIEEAPDGSLFERALNLSEWEHATVSRQLRADLALDGLVYPNASFSTATATSTPARVGGDSCISLALVVDVPLGSGATVTVSGLTGLQTRVALLPAVVETPTRRVARFGKWDQNAGSIVFTLVAPVRAGEALDLKFTVINAAAELPPRVLMLTVRDGNILANGNHVGLRAPLVVDGTVLAPTAGAECELATSAAWAGQTCPTQRACTLRTSAECLCAGSCPTAALKRIPSALNAYDDVWETVMDVTDTTRHAALDNNVSFVIQPDRILPAGSALTIAGLTGTMTVDRSANADCPITGRCFCGGLG